MTLLKTLSNLFKGRALLANTISGAVLFVLGDAIEQKFEINSGEIAAFDYERLGRIGLVGVSEGPTHIIFYQNLDKYLPGKSVKTVFQKVLADQMIACPVFSFQFFMGMSLLEGQTLKDCWAEFVHKFPTVYVVDWCVWPPCQFINFYLVPRRYRVLYVNTITVAWNVFLSYMKHYDKHPLKKPTP